MCRYIGEMVAFRLGGAAALNSTSGLKHLATSTWSNGATFVNSQLTQAMPCQESTNPF